MSSRDADEILVLGRGDVAQATPMRDLIAEIDKFFREAPISIQPQRIISSMEGGVWLFMPSYIRGYGVVVKTVNEYQLPNHAHGIVEIYDGKTGVPLAVINAVEVTLRRTGALGGLAVKYVYGGKSAVVGLIGSGDQARGQLEGIASVLMVERAYVYSRHREGRERFSAEMSSELGIDVVALEDPRKAVELADVVVTATNSTVPVLDGRWLREGSHVNSLGTLPDRRELDGETFKRASKVVFDTKEGVMREAGDVIHAIQEKALDEGKIVGELADVIRSGGLR
ncbi:MAG: ornithine cyclodeaminase family protein, partial [Conexivisphaera sp.]